MFQISRYMKRSLCTYRPIAIDTLLITDVLLSLYGYHIYILYLPILSSFKIYQGMKKIQAFFWYQNLLLIIVMGLMWAFVSSLMVNRGPGAGVLLRISQSSPLSFLEIKDWSVILVTDRWKAQEAILGKLQ